MAPEGQTYYVAPSGNDNNAGSLTKPWRTISRATDEGVLKPGDIVYIRTGTYNEHVRPRTSGAVGNPIIYRNYPGETPIISGNDGSSWRLAVLDQSYLRFEGLTFKDYVGGAIQVRTIAKDIVGIEIVDNTFQNQTPESGSSSKTINVTPSSTGNVVSQITIQDNQFFNMNTYDAPVIQFDGEVVSSKINGNILVGSTNIGIGIAGRLSKGQPRNILIKGNDISGHGRPNKHSAGIYLDGAGSNIVIEENVIHDGLQGIKVDIEPAAATLITQGVIVRHNILYNNSQMNLKMGAAETCSKSGAVQNTVTVHNTIYSDINNDANVVFDCSVHIQWKNNIFVHNGPQNGFQYRFMGETLNTSTWTLNNNLFLNQSGQDTHYKWMGSSYDSLSSFQIASGKEIHSIEGFPKFTDVSNFDFSLQANSKARDAGGALTTTSSAGNGTVIPVKNSWFFSDGMGLQTGDKIRVGNNNVVEVLAVDHNNHTIRVSNDISWNNNSPVTYDYYGGAPDMGAQEFIPSLAFTAIPQDQALLLTWEVNDTLAANTIWQLEFGIPGQNSTKINLNGSERSYHITSLNNYQFYNITLSAIVDDEVLWTQQVQAMPTDIFTFLPFVRK